ncbi:MAG: integral rane protein [Frankiales bacterium]|nr:integral rane protein [Frankiales bacterium]
MLTGADGIVAGMGDARLPTGVRPARSLAVTRLSPLVIAGLSAATALAYISASEDTSDALASALLEVPWLPLAAVAVLVALASIHFLSAACALRAVSGRRLDLRPTTFVQVAAAATNRIVPNGIGGTGLNFRYLLRAGVAPGAAASGLAALALLGGATDAGYAAALTAVGPAIGLTGAARELSSLTAGGVRVGQQHLALIATAAVLISAVVLARGRRAGRAGLAAGARQAISHARALVSRPRRLGTAALASTATTVAMSAGFVLAVDVWGQAAHPLPTGALITIYLVAAAAGGATPLPSFFAVTELALIAALVLAGYSSASALVAVVMFQAVTFWLPLPVGLWLGQRLRKSQLL